MEIPLDSGCGTNPTSQLGTRGEFRQFLLGSSAILLRYAYSHGATELLSSGTSDQFRIDGAKHSRTNSCTPCGRDRPMPALSDVTGPGEFVNIAELGVE